MRICRFLQRFVMQVHVGPHIKGHIHMTEVFDPLCDAKSDAFERIAKRDENGKETDDPEDRRKWDHPLHPFHSFRVGQIVQGRVLRIDHVTAKHRKLAVTHQNVWKIVILSLYLCL